MLAQVLDSRVRVDDPELTDLSGVDVVVVDLGIELTRSATGWSPGSRCDATADDSAAAPRYTSSTGSTCTA